MLSAFKLARMFVVAAATLTVIACGDDLGLDDWEAVPDTVTIYSLSRSDLIGKPSAYDFVNHIELRAESPASAGVWDVAARHENGQLAVAPAASFEGQNSRAAIAAVSGTSFEELAEAPADTTQFSTAPLVVAPGQVFVVRTRRAPCAFSNSIRYGKAKVLEVDATAGFIKFVAITNPFCNDRALIPPNQD